MTKTHHPSLTTQDERVMAGLSHISALVPMMGIIAPIVIWVTHKEKSEYVGFQSLQALAYQFAMIMAQFIGMGCYFVSFFGMFFTIPFIPPEGSADSASPFALMPAIFPFLFMGIYVLGGFMLISYAVFGAIRSFQGKPFRYALIGNLLTRLMESR